MFSNFDTRIITQQNSSSTFSIISDFLWIFSQFYIYFSHHQKVKIISISILQQYKTKIIISQMSSLRDKINKQLSINTAGKPSPQSKPSNFDQTWLKITVVGGQTQLCPIKLNCQWTVPQINSKPPQLACKWFNKTQNSMSLIDGVFGSYYQPCIADVGTVIHVQCVPELEGSEYDGMPIIKQIGPIKIDPETQEQSNDLLTAKKATFSIKIKSTEFVDASYSEGLIKIQRLNFRVISKHHQAQKQLINLQISESFPSFKCINGKSRQLEITYAQNSKLLVQLSSNKVRDVLNLLIKLINANREQLEDKPKPKVQEQVQEVALMPMSYPQQKEEEQKMGSSTALEISNEFHNESIKSQVVEDASKADDIKQIKTKQSDKQASLHQNSNSKSQASEEQLKQSKNDVKLSKKKNVSEIKSSEDLSFTSPIIKKGGSKAQQSSSQVHTPASSKLNSLQMLQISDLKKQLRTNQGQIFQLKKTIGEKDETIEGFKQQINRMKQRETNLSCNYFQLQDQIKKFKSTSEKSSEQVSYYKNENRILKTENDNLQKKNKMQTQQIFQLQKKLQPFIVPDQKEEEVESYSEIKQKYEKLQVTCEQFQVKYAYMKQESEKSQEKYNELKENVDKIENEKNFYKKKYENITLQMQSHASSPVSTSKLGKQKLYSSRLAESSPIEEVKVEQNQHQIDQYEKQILQLKKKLKSLVEQNNFLREVNSLAVKDKKSSSKTQLKIELVQMKKVANRLTQDVTQKDFALQNMKKINRQISDKLLEASRVINEYEKKQMEQKHTVKHTNSMS